MPTVSEVFPKSADHLKAADLQGKSIKLQISDYEIVEFKGDSGRPERKIVISFHGKEKKLVCNVTNARTIENQHGSDLDGWRGKEVILYPTKVDFAGNQVDAIRVKEIVPEPVDDLDSIPF
jgi:hypothetical protein